LKVSVNRCFVLGTIYVGRNITVVLKNSDLALTKCVAQYRIYESTSCVPTILLLLWILNSTVCFVAVAANKNLLASYLVETMCYLSFHFSRKYDIATLIPNNNTLHA